MSVLFGIRKPLGAGVTEAELLCLASATERFALNGSSTLISGHVGMGFQPCYTHARSRDDRGLVRDATENVLAFDGRLDNYEDLGLRLSLDVRSVADSTIALAAFSRWGKDCFSRLVGDWAIALWSAQEQCLYLARDHAGTRTLYFHQEGDTIRWSTYLETFFTDGRTFHLDHDYAACYLASCPIRELTPYQGIRAVLPAHYLMAKQTGVVSAAHWVWMAKDTIHYTTDTEYEDHFLMLLKQSIQRRTGPGAPIMAQLSGGMDSTSIVCMSDAIRRLDDPNAEILDTISFYDNSEPHWNESPYFSIVEERRGKVGIHMDMSPLQSTFEPVDSSVGVYFLPGADSCSLHQESRLFDAIYKKGYRVILSGIGGDELLGGVPSPLPELATYLLSGKLTLLLSRATAWCLIDRSPLVYLLTETLNYTSRLYFQPSLASRGIPRWVSQSLRRRCQALVGDDLLNLSRIGLRPCVIDNGISWWSVMESMPHLFPRMLVRPEYRYPLLDRDLVDFLLRVPREQLLQPGRRRSLMRRALVGIVPNELLERRRKAYQSRTPVLAVRQAQTKLSDLLANARIVDEGLADSKELCCALKQAAQGHDLYTYQAVIRAIALELWLRSSDSLVKKEPLAPAKHDSLARADSGTQDPYATSGKLA